MALLQIAEPGQSAAPHQHRLAVGIDLGTTNSLVAGTLSGVATVLADAAGRTLLPSVVRFPAPGSPALIGAEALDAPGADPRQTLFSIKRLMGRSLADVPDARDMPFALVDQPGTIGIETAAGIKTPIEVSAEILLALRRRAEAALGGDLAGAVITVPAYFDDAQRQATKDAARLAGLKVLRLLNEPTAAAIAYGLDNAAVGLYAIFDLGGGTFDFSLLRLTNGIFEVLATSGDPALGGDDFDRCVYDWMVASTDLGTLQATDVQRLRALARSAKEALSDAESVAVSAALANGRLAHFTLTRTVFDALTRDLVQRTLLPTRQALRDARLDPRDIQGVVLVGGSTRLLNVRRAVREFFGREPLTNLDPDQVVAVGAAMQANLLAGNRNESDWLLLDVCPLSLGIETMGGLVERIIDRNSTLPVSRAQEFTTFRDGQTAISLHIVQGERDLAAHCRSLARFELRGIPPMVAGAARVRVSFQIDADGLLSVCAREQGSGIESRIEVKPSYGLADDEIARLLEESFERAGSDLKLRRLREAQVEARRLVDATEAALAQDGHDLLAPEERGAINARLFALAEVLESGADDSLDALLAASAALGSATQDFAARRMNASVQRLMAGRRLEDIGSAA